jgi:hypothetical protein
LALPAGGRARSLGVPKNSVIAFDPLNLQEKARWERIFI